MKIDEDPMPKEILVRRRQFKDEVSEYVGFSSEKWVTSLDREVQIGRYVLVEEYVAEQVVRKKNAPTILTSSNVDVIAAAIRGKVEELKAKE